MIIIALAALALLAISLSLGAYFRAGERDKLRALALWRELNPRIEAFIDRDDVPEIVAKHVTMFAVIAGCGCVTTLMLRDVFARRVRSDAANSNAPVELTNLPEEVQHELARLLLGLLMFDSLNVPLRGRIMRFLMKPPVPSVVAVQQNAELEGINSVIVSTKKATTEAIRRGKVPNAYQLVAA